MKIVEYPHPALRHKARPVTTIDKALRRLVEEMFELMHERRGVGLAGPQVAVPYQLFVMQPDPEVPEGRRVLINPVLSDRKGSVEAEEGCLSLPGLYQKIRRAREIRVQAYDENGRPVDAVLTDFEARIVQHETDHLQGILFIDKLGLVGRLASRGALAEFETTYRRAQARGEIPAEPELLRQLRELEEKGLAALPEPAPRPASPEGVT
jgi:peptide deformylase